MDIFLDPEKILDQLSLRADMLAAEFGCGSGGFAIPLAKKLEDGLVYALDIQEAPLSALKSRFLIEKLENIKIVKCDIEKPNGSMLDDCFLDLALIVNTLFQTEDKKSVITEAKRVLKKGGVMLIIDWKKEVLQGPIQGRVLPEEIKKLANSIGGLRLEKEFEASAYHFGLIFRKE